MTAGWRGRGRHQGRAGPVWRGRGVGIFPFELALHCGGALRARRCFIGPVNFGPKIGLFLCLARIGLAQVCQFL
jgi:hypothetical protein